MLTPGECAVCGGPVDPKETEVAIIPKGFAHADCFHSLGAGVTDFVRGIPCCSGRSVISSWGGHLVVRRPGIPEGETWVSTTQGELLRFMNKNGELSCLGPDNTETNNAD